MSNLAFTIFWTSSALLLWVYIVYPLLALVYGRFRPVRLIVRSGPPAVVTVGLAAHNGAADIEQRLTDIAAQTVPMELELIVASDGSEDETAHAVRRFAIGDPRVKLIELPRSGQSAAQAAIFEAARGEVVVLTDVETRFAPGCLTALLAPFTDPSVGCATGVLRWRFDAATETARHEGFYWRYEQAVRAWESRAGWLSAGTGALLAVRRSLYRPVSADASLDQMLPLVAREQGARVLVAPQAVGTDRGTASLGHQFTSRTRIATQGIEANLRMSLHVLPWRRPGSFLAIWSHKILRWATPFLGLSTVLAGLWLWLAGGPAVYLLPGGLAVLVGVLALVGYLGQRAGRMFPLTGFPLTLVAVNLAFALAWLNVLVRRRVSAW